MCLVQTLAGNNIPETMIMSAIILRTSYRWLHVGGVLVIIAGTAVALLTANCMVALTNVKAGSHPQALLWQCGRRLSTLLQAV